MNGMVVSSLQSNDDEPSVPAADSSNLDQDHNASVAPALNNSKPDAENKAIRLIPAPNKQQQPLCVSSHVFWICTKCSETHRDVSDAVLRAIAAP